LWRGAASPRDFEGGLRTLQNAELTRDLDPRWRIVNLWRNTGKSRSVTLNSLRQFHRSAFPAAAHIVAYVKRRD
jgi:hypothetical protein